MSTTRINARPAMPAMTLDSWSSCFWSGVFSVVVLERSLAMCPISVFMPVAVTINSPRPRVTDVFMNAMHVRSPSGTSPTAAPQQEPQSKGNRGSRDSTSVAAADSKHSSNSSDPLSPASAAAAEAVKVDLSNR